MAYKIDKFIKMYVPDRFKFVKNSRCCVNCLECSHTLKDCAAPILLNVESMHKTDMALFSPKKLHLPGLGSPSIRGSARKRRLFPSVSPQSDDLGVIMELDSSSDDSASVYSPPLPSPCSSVGFSPLKERNIRDSDSSPNFRIKNVLKSSNYFGSPLKSQKKSYYGKENIDSAVRTSHKKSLKKSILDSGSFDESFTVESPLKENYLRNQIEMKSSDNFTTPKKTTETYNERNGVIRRSPRSASKTNDCTVIKPISFYGNMAPILATNQTNRIQGMKCVFRPPQQSKAKAKLLFEDKPKKKRARSKSLDAMREAKRRKAVHTGVHHAIPRPVNDSPINMPLKKENIRVKAKKITDLSRTPYGMKKNQNDGWEYTLRFTKPMRHEDTLEKKRKFFKTSLHEQPSLTSPLILNKASAIPLPKKRKLFDSSLSYLKVKSPEKSKLALDVQQLIKDFDDDDNSQSGTPELQDILFRLEEEEEEEGKKKKESDKRMLNKMLEESPNKTAEIDSLSNCTASLDLNELSGSSSRDSTESSAESNSTPLHFFPIFNNAGKTPKTEGCKNHISTGKKKWMGLGENQLQIDAGQLTFGPKQCAGCGMIYQAGEPEDEMQHSTFHHSLNTLKYLGWKNENVVGRIGQDYIIMVTEDDPKSWQQKAQDIIALVDKSLGITNSGTHTVMHKMKVFLYISGRRIVGCTVTQHTTRGYKMICSESDVDLVSEDAYPVRCGVSRVWTLYSQRRKGIATRLLDAVRCNFMYGCILSTNDIAFSVPTPDGKRFATKYMGTPNFLVYYSY